MRELRCAIYTRKSSEEGLEQGFNSLHAQREACEAYIISQKHEGWRALPTIYDDGGYSGGSMIRPALAQLLADIKDRKIDVVVVYKVDRLTRALTDFAKIVEIFDANNVSFVSVTQAFNTTSSMGRLTLNVLLSFAQFEREVTGERIRDKIAASKAKGMWMGGHVPMGFRRKDRTLLVESVEAELVRMIFRRYLELGTVEALQKALIRDGVRTPDYRTIAGRSTGGRPFMRGHLYEMLANVLYIGKIKHRGIVYEGLHEAIVDQDTWDQVQARLSRHRYRERVSSRAANPSILAGLVRDDLGRKMGVTHTHKGSVRHRYYRSLLAPDESKSTRLNVPARMLEPTVCSLLGRILRDRSWLTAQTAIHTSDLAVAIYRAEHLATELETGDVFARGGVITKLVREIRLGPDFIEIDLRSAAVIDLPAETAQSVFTTIRETARFERRGQELKLVIPAAGPPEPEPDPALIKALAQAHRWWRDLQACRYATLGDLAEAYDTDQRYAAFVLRLAFLSPDLTNSILQGTQPYGLTLHRLLWKVDLPICWRAQQRMAIGASSTGLDR
jgi:DNA invertase Pin-like site-specific DNA recombinase